MVAQRGTIRRVIVEQVGETQDAGWRPWQIDPRMPVVPLGAGGAVQSEGEDIRQLAGSEWGIDRTDLPEPMPARYRSASRIIRLPTFVWILQQRGRGARGAAVPIWTTEEETYILQIVNGKLVWSPLKHSLLDGNIHPDTTAGVCQQGDVIVGGAGNKWTRLAKGNNGQVFTIVNGEPVWNNPPEATGGIGGNIHVQWVGDLAASQTIEIDNNRDWRGRLVVAASSATDSANYDSVSWQVGMLGPDYAVGCAKVGTDCNSGTTLIVENGGVSVPIDNTNGHLEIHNEEAVAKRVHVWAWATDPQQD